MKLKSFKQFFKEEVMPDDIKIRHNLLVVTIRGYNYLIDNFGLIFKEDDKPKMDMTHEAPENKPYFTITLDKLYEKLTQEQTLFVESDRTIKVPFYKLINPKTRIQLKDMLEPLGYTIDMDDSKLKKIFGDESWYLYPRQ